MGGLLSREAILQAQDLPHEDVEVPEWGGVVRVRTLTGAERDKLEADTAKRKGKNIEYNLANFRARLLALCIVDEDGNRVFSDADVKLLGQKSAAALERIVEVANRLSGFSQEDVDELTGNSETGQSDDSTSD